RRVVRVSRALARLDGAPAGCESLGVAGGCVSKPRRCRKQREPTRVARARLCVADELLEQANDARIGVPREHGDAGWRNDDAGFGLADGCGHSIGCGRRRRAGATAGRMLVPHVDPTKWVWCVRAIDAAILLPMATKKRGSSAIRHRKARRKLILALG